MGPIQRLSGHMFLDDIERHRTHLKSWLFATPRLFCILSDIGLHLSVAAGTWALLGVLAGGDGSAL